MIGGITDCHWDSFFVQTKLNTLSSTFETATLTRCSYARLVHRIVWEHLKYVTPLIIITYWVLNVCYGPMSTLAQSLIFKFYYLFLEKIWTGFNSDLVTRIKQTYSYTLIICCHFHSCSTCLIITYRCSHNILNYNCSVYLFISY